MILLIINALYVCFVLAEAKFYHLAIADIGAVDYKAYQRAHLMPALIAGSAGIDMKHTELQMGLGKYPHIEE